MNPVGAVLGGRSGAQATMNPVGAVFGGRSGAQATMNLVGAVFDGRSDAQATMTPVGAVLGGRSGAEAIMGSARPGEPFVPRLGEVLGRTVLSAQPVADPGRVPPGTSGKVTFSDVGFQSVGGGGGQRGPHVRISDYDGETDLTAFLSRFDRVAQLYRWSEDEQMIHLETSLKGAAADIVYDIEPTTTIEEMKDMLRLRFGTDRQGEVTRTELQHTRRQSGEPLQKLYRTIKKLMSVGYPGPTTAMKNWIGRDHFLRALNDDQLCIQVSIQKPQTLEEALTTALELEALGVGREGERLRRETQAGSSQRDRARSPRTPQFGLAYEATSIPEIGHASDVDALVRVIGSWADWQHTNQSRTPSETAQNSGSFMADSRGAERGGGGGWGRGWPATTETRSQLADKSLRANDICNWCQKNGHWARDCPEKQASLETATRRVVTRADEPVGGSDREDEADDSIAKRGRVVTAIVPEIQKLSGAVFLPVQVR